MRWQALRRCSARKMDEPEEDSLRVHGGRPIQTSVYETRPYLIRPESIPRPPSCTRCRSSCLSPLLVRHPLFLQTRDVCSASHHHLWWPLPYRSSHVCHVPCLPSASPSTRCHLLASCARHRQSFRGTTRSSSWKNDRAAYRRRARPPLEATKVGDARSKLGPIHPHPPVRSSCAAVFIPLAFVSA